MPNLGICALVGNRLRNYCRKHLLRVQRTLFSDKSDQGEGFFDAYPRFFETSSTFSTRNRLNKRYRALIESNLEIIRGSSLLDIASHDGRWSFAAHKAGARYVLGIEAREPLVAHARESIRTYKVPEGQVEFVVGDVFVKLDQLEPGRFETIFCLGFFYHTMDHMRLLNKIARLRPAHLLLDTRIDVDNTDSVVVLQSELVTHEGAGAIPDVGTPERILVGTPTKSALELMLASAGFPSMRYYDWHRAGIRRWDNLIPYQQGQRVTVVATRNSA